LTDFRAIGSSTMEYFTQRYRRNLKCKRFGTLGILFSTEIFYVVKRTPMDKTKFYKTVCNLVEDYFDTFSRKPHYLLINSKFDLENFIDQEDWKQYVNDRFKGMLIVRTPDIEQDKMIVY
jgi:hypothetical protein